MEKVRSKIGVPIVDDFRSDTGTPIVIDESTGLAYVYVNGAIVQLNQYQGDAFATVQAGVDAINALGGGLLVLSKPSYSFGTTQLTLKSNVVILAEGVTATYTGSSAFITSATTGVLEHAGIIGGIWDGGSSCTKVMELRSAYKCKFDCTLKSNSATCISLDMLVNTSGGTNPDGNRNFAFCDFDGLLQEGSCGKGVHMKGDSTTPTVVTLNTFTGYNARDCAVHGIDFEAWCDYNKFIGSTRIAITANNAIGVEWNSGTPGSNVGVYANNFTDLAVDNFGTKTGRVGIKMNWTKDNYVAYYFNEPAAEGGAYSFSANAQSYYVGHLVGGTVSFIIRTKGTYYQGADQGLFFIGGADMSTETAGAVVGFGRSGSGASYLSLVGDTTYTDYGIRIIRNSGGANTSSQILHKGTGNLEVKCQTAGGQFVVYDSGGNAKFVTNDTGVGFQGSAGLAKPTITGSRAGNAALASLLAQLANYGLITDGTTA